MRQLIILCLAFGVLGCAQGHCRKSKTPKGMEKPATAEVPSAQPPVEVAAPKVEKKQTEDKKVWVYKSDGTKQCDKRLPIALKDQVKELKFIEVYSMKRVNDGLMHLTVCGGDTGFYNAYQVDESEINRAKKYGFKLWGFSELSPNEG